MKTESEDTQLDRKHCYFVQVQGQVHTKEAEYGDIVVWNEHDIFMERLCPDQNFWADALSKANIFFTECILPEVLGLFFFQKQSFHDVVTILIAIFW